MGGRGHGRQTTAALVSALASMACAAESLEPHELRPEFADLCGATRAIVDGLERCESGVWHKTGPVLCPATGQPGTREHYQLGVWQGQNNRGMNPQCMNDRQCTDGPNGFCATRFDTRPIPMQCKYGCTTDGECGAGRICECDEAFGVCVSADCRSDASCAPGFACTSWSDGCDGHGFACETPDDECWSGADCGEGSVCTSNGSRRVCGPSPACSDDAG